MSKAKSDKVLEAAKKKLGDAIEQIDVKQQGGVADLAKLCDTLTKMKEVEIKADEGTFGAGLGD